jgi:tetratricopeptide (TPR) repeat protein
VIEALLAVSAEAPELARARTRWLAQLLESKQDQPAEALELSLQGAEASPEAAELWETAHEMARKLGDPSKVAEAYERTLERKLLPEVAGGIGQRMVEFLEEWFDDPDHVHSVLERVLELSPAAEWAFDRLKLTFNSAGRWPELFALYDRRLEFGTKEKDEEVSLLREAAMAAKDFASDAERAIGYLERINRLSPGDTRVETTLERLYERHGRTRPLIDLLSARLSSSRVTDAAELAARIAALWLDLNETPPAFELAAGLLESGKADEAAVALLERVLTLPAAREQHVGDGPPSVLERSALLLEKRYRKQGLPVDVVRMLEIEVDTSLDPKRKAALLSEVAELREEKLDDPQGAFDTLVDLVALAPTAPPRARLAALAGLLQSQERRAETLVGVAEPEPDGALRAELLYEAATVYDQELAATEEAAELMRKVVRLRDKKPARVSQVDLPYTLGLGVRWKLSPRLDLATHGIFRTWSGANSDLLASGGTGADNTVEAAIGGEYIGDPRRPFRRPIRFGARYATLPFPLEPGRQPTEFGVSVGSGVRFAQDRAGIDLSVEHLWRTAGDFKERAFVIFVGVGVRP